MQKDIKIALYESWMRNQVIRMICRQYGREEAQQGKLMEDFYEHPYQREKSLRIVAIDGNKVVGFQSFFYWPYLLDGKHIRTYQSGNTIVDPDYRGQRIFQRTLEYMDMIREDKQIDFLTGFPIMASYNSMVNNKWVNILNLKWYFKVISPFSVLRKYDFAKLSLDVTAKPMAGISIQKGFTLNYDSEFEIWRKYYNSGENHYFYFHYVDGRHQVRFDLKVNLRGKLKELIVGRVQRNCDNLDFLTAALKTMISKVREQHAFTFLSVALNDRFYKNDILQVFTRVGFKRLNKQIFFLVKDYTVGEQVFQPELWELYRSDVDTW